MNMIRPSDEEKERAVEYILSKGLKKPKSLWQELYDMYRALGLRYVFYDAASSMGIAVFVMIGFYMISLMSSEQYTNASMFAAAPVFFIFVLILTETAERMSVVYELKMTCKYTIRQIAAFRILCFSLMGTVFCTLASLFVGYTDIGDFLRPFSLSLCALFLCSFLSLYIIEAFRKIPFTPVLLWFAMNLLPLLFFGEHWENFLSRVPIALTFCVAFVAFVLFITEIKKLMKIKREVPYYAGC